MYPGIVPRVGAGSGGMRGRSSNGKAPARQMQIYENLNHSNTVILRHDSLQWDLEAIGALREGRRLR